MSSMQDFLFEKNVRRQFAALGFPRVEVSAQSILMRDGQPVLRDDGTPETITRILDYYRDVDSILHPEFIKEMRKFNMMDNNIYMKPTETDSTIYILVDDTTPQLYDRFTPNVHIQTSLPHKQQAVFAVPWTHDRTDTPRREARRLYMDIFTYLNLAYGDDGIRGFRHAFRIPGLSNRKADYAPNFPFVKLLSAKKTADPRIVNWIDDCAAGRFPLLREIARMKEDLGKTGKITVNPDPEPDTSMPEDEPDRAPSSGSRRVKAGSGVDRRGDDMSASLSMAWDGATAEEIEAEILKNSSHLADPCEYDLNSSRYARRTAENAVAAVTAAREKITEKRTSRKPAPRPAQRPGYNKSVFLNRPWPKAAT